MTGTFARVLLVNGALRLAAAASGQLFAFVLAERYSREQTVGPGLGVLLSAGYYFTELLGAPLAGQYADRAGIGKVMAWGPRFGLLCAGLTVLALGPLGALPLGTVVGLFVARVLEGASAACVVSTSLMLLAQDAERAPEQNARRTGAFELVSVVSMVLGYAVAGLFWEAHREGSFLVLAALYGLGAFVAQGLVRDVSTDAQPRQHARERFAQGLGASLRWLRTQQASLPFALSWLAVNAVVGAWLQHAPYLFKLPLRHPQQRLVGGYSGHDLAVFFGAWGLSFLSGLVLWTFVGARWPRSTTMRSGLWAMLGVCGCLAGVNHGGPSALLGLAVLCVLVESGFTPAALGELTQLAAREPAHRGLRAGIYSLLLGVGQWLGSALGAPCVVYWKMDGLLGLTMVLAVLALLVLRTRKGHEAER